MAEAGGSGAKKRPNYDTHHKGSVGRTAKKKFHGNRFSKKEEDEPERPSSASRRKLLESAESDTAKKRSTSLSNEGPGGYRIISWDALNQLELLVVCKQCHGYVTFSEESVRGYGFRLVVKCSDCDAKKISSSPLSGKKNNAYEVNTRAVLGMRVIGQGLAGLQQFSWIMDLPCIAQSSYDLAITRLKNAADRVVEESMNRACQQEVEQTGCSELYVSGDGTWRKKGFSSLQGVATVIGNNTGKVLDFDARSAYCKECELWDKKCGTQEYLDWIDEHMESCQANHEGSSGKMEVDSVVKIFKRSQDKHGVQYKYYIGDGDCKTYKAVCDASRA